eukprot:TRINITY_DN29840_c0_g1_i1.p1 TRINITY_DN29840_c0_g1~~TRINITY_DN29840_c0_g1_i1.p1  ORF type:complete len:488 (-),score=104.28 TRINITY_DN29840_c0_g1_i1:434-1897(-)
MGSFGGESEFDALQAEKMLSGLRSEDVRKKTKSFAWRQGQLKALEKMLLKHESDMLEVLKADLGKPGVEAYSSEVSPALSETRTALAKLKGWMKPKAVSTNLCNNPGTSEIMAEPYGVVLIIVPWNYPFLLSLLPLVGAIAAGNAVVLKPSELAPASSALLARLCRDYLDATAIRVVLGAVEETKVLLEQKWDKIFFTGSTAVGRIVAAAAAKHLTPTTLELGGKCPVVIDSTVNLKMAAKRIIFGRLFNAGQSCLAADYVMVEESFTSKLIEELKTVLAEWYGEDGLPSNALARIVNEKHLKRLQGYLQLPGVADSIVFGGQSNEKELYMAPTLVRDVPWDSPLLSEEIFGPVLPIQSVSSISEAIARINSQPKPLAIYPFTNDARVAKRIVDETSSGGVLINDCLMHSTNDAIPFGGVGDSGYGAYHGKFSFDDFSHFKGVMNRPFVYDPPARFPPYNRYQDIMLRALVDGDFLGIILILLGIRR